MVRRAPELRSPEQSARRTLCLPRQTRLQNSKPDSPRSPVSRATPRIQPCCYMCTNSAQTSLANHHHLRNVANIDSRRTNSGSHSQRSLVIRRVVCPPHVRVCTKSVRPRYLPRISSQTVSQKDAGLRDTFLPTSATAPCGTEAGVRRRPLITNRSVPLRFHPTTATGTTGFLPAYGRSWVSRSTSA